MKSSAGRGNELREVMDIRQASDYLGISPDTLYKYASDAFIPAFKLGNRWRFRKSRLDEWMDRQWQACCRASLRRKAGAPEAEEAGAQREKAADGG